MEKGTSTELEQAIQEIVQHDDLPPDFLKRVASVVQQHEDADALYEWTMQLAPHLRQRDIRVIGRLLQHGLAVLRDRRQLDSQSAVTLPSQARDTLRELWAQGGATSGPALFVLGFDVLTRAQNRSQRAESSPAT